MRLCQKNEGLKFKWFVDMYVQWLPEQMECGNLQIGKQAVALWIPMAQK